MTVDPLPAGGRGAAIRASLAGARPPGAAPAGAGADALRDAYLDLLKLCLSDLTGSTTVSVGPTPEGDAVARELRGDQLRLRSAGLDWPLQGLTMSGLRRLDDLQACVSSVVRDGVEGDLIEAGAWRGGSSILMRATLDALGDHRDRVVWVADSFQGFPRADDDQGELSALLSAYDFLVAPEQEVRDNFARFGYERGVRFVPGFFKDTLPHLGDRRWAIVRLDSDSYEATRIALESLYPALADGGYVIVDDYGAAGECQAAVDEFRRDRAITEPFVTVDWTCVRWRRGDEASARELRPDGRNLASTADSARTDEQDIAEAQGPVLPAESLRVPTVGEVALAHRVTELRERLADAQGRQRRQEDLLRTLLSSRAFSLAARLSRLRQGGHPAFTKESVRSALEG